MNRDTTELCRHALAEFAFLPEHDFTESHFTSDSCFSIKYRSVNCLQIGVGAFLPRYEYDVSLSCDNNRCHLHELAAILDTYESGEPNWTWAHSDPLVFSQHVAYSAMLLRILLPEILRDNGSIWNCIAQRRATMAAREHHTQQLENADAAFSDGRWRDAIAIYESVASLSPVQEKRLGIAKRRFNRR